jgi:hypothetical protein
VEHERELSNETMGESSTRPRRNNGDKRKVEKNNRRKAEPHPDDDEQLQDEEEQPRAPHNYAGGAWRYRARVDIVPRKIETIVMKRGVK